MISDFFPPKKAVKQAANAPHNSAEMNTSPTKDPQSQGQQPNSPKKENQDRKNIMREIDTPNHPKSPKVDPFTYLNHNLRNLKNLIRKDQKINQVIDQFISDNWRDQQHLKIKFIKRKYSKRKLSYIDTKSERTIHLKVLNCFCCDKSFSDFKEFIIHLVFEHPDWTLKILQLWKNTKVRAYDPTTSLYFMLEQDPGLTQFPFISGNKEVTGYQRRKGKKEPFQLSLFRAKIQTIFVDSEVTNMMFLRFWAPKPTSLDFRLGSKIPEPKQVLKLKPLHSKPHGKPMNDLQEVYEESEDLGELFYSKSKFFFELMRSCPQTSMEQTLVMNSFRQSHELVMKLTAKFEASSSIRDLNPFFMRNSLKIAFRELEARFGQTGLKNTSNGSRLMSQMFESLAVCFLVRTKVDLVDFTKIFASVSN